MRDCVVCFTCGRDARLMPLHAAAVRRVLPDAGLVYVVPEGEAGVFVPGVMRQYGAQLVESVWERGDRLSGPEAVQGILGTLAVCGERCGGAVVKLDADTVLLDVGWLEGLRCGARYVGFESWQPMLPTGACYGFSAAGAAAAAEEVQRWRWRGGTEYLPEDRAVYLTALGVLGADAVCVPWCAGGGRVMGFAPRWFGVAGVPAGTVAVHCGEKPLLAMTGKMGLDRGRQVERAMRRVLADAVGR